MLSCHVHLRVQIGHERVAQADGRIENLEQTGSQQRVISHVIRVTCVKRQLHHRRQSARLDPVLAQVKVNVTARATDVTTSQ